MNCRVETSASSIAFLSNNAPAHNDHLYFTESTCYWFKSSKIGAFPVRKLYHKELRNPDSCYHCAFVE
jgi:hypothetical protein